MPPPADNNAVINQFSPQLTITLYRQPIATASDAYFARHFSSFEEFSLFKILILRFYLFLSVHNYSQIVLNHYCNTLILYIRIALRLPSKSSCLESIRERILNSIQASDIACSELLTTSPITRVACINSTLGIS